MSLEFLFLGGGVGGWGVVDIPPEISYHLRGRNKFSLVRRERTKNTSVINLILFDSWSKKLKSLIRRKMV